MLQYQLDLFMNMNEKLTYEVKVAHWRIAKLTIDDGIETRLAMGGTSTLVARVSQGVQIENPRVMGTQST